MLSYVPRFAFVIALVATTARAETNTDRGCRVTPFPASLWRRARDGSELTIKRDFDGDGVPDLLRARQDGGAGSDSTQATLQLSSSNRSFDATAGVDFSSMITFTTVPENVAANRTARSILEDALFTNVCEKADPSLAWLLDRTHALHFIVGPPTLPTNYAVYAKGVWIDYLGSNHARDTTGALSRGFVELASDSKRVLLGTAHGVVLTDPARSRHAWIYVVETSSKKLRFPSVLKAHFDRDVAVIETIDGPVRVDLTR